MKKKIKILVTGSAGFVGTNLIERLSIDQKKLINICAAVNENKY